LRKKHSYSLNPRTEIKNLNSFKFMVEALKEEVEKQLNYYLEHKEFRPDQTTVLFDADLKQTKTMRKKEYEADYRFISEPDLPFVSIKNAVTSIDVDLSALPFAVESILIKGGVLPQDAKFFTADSLRSETFVTINNTINDPSFVAKTLTNNIKPEDYHKIENIQDFIEIFRLFKDEKVTAVLVQNAIKSLLENAHFDYKTYFEENSISEEKIQDAIAKVISENEATANDIKAGNQGKAGILVGKVIAIIGKGASGKVIREGILKQLEGSGVKVQSSNPDSYRDQDPRPKTQDPTTTNQQPATKEEVLPQIPIIIKDEYRTHVISDIYEKNITEKVTFAG